MAPNARRRVRLLAIAATVLGAAVIFAVARGRGDHGAGSRPGERGEPPADSWASPSDGADPRPRWALPAAINRFRLAMRPAGPPIVVTGVVLLMPEGTPVAGAEVAFMNDSGDNTATADGAGRYSISVASGVWWRVHARTEGAVGYPETFVPSVTTPVRDLEIQATARVRGRVRDTRGALVPGAEVSVVVAPEVRGLLETALPLTTLADDAGRFELSAMPGAIRVKAARGLSQGVADLPMVAPGATASVDVTIKDAVTVAGRVVGGDDQPVAGAKVLVAAMLEVGGPTEKFRFDSGADGRFAFSVPAGQLRLEVRHGGELSAATMHEVPSGGSLENLVIRIAAPVALRGRVMTSDRTPVEGAKVRLSANTFYDTVSLGDGSFAVDAVAGQPYSVRIKHSSGTVARYVAAWNDEETFVMPQFGGLEIAVKQRPPDVTVTIDAFSPDGEAAPRVPAVVRFRGRDGRVVMADLEPGLYDLTVSSRGLASVSLRERVSEASQRTVDVELAPPAPPASAHEDARRLRGAPSTR